MNVNSVVPEESYVISFEAEGKRIRLYVDRDEMNQKMKEWDETGEMLVEESDGGCIGWMERYRPSKISLYKEIITLTKETE